MLGNASVKQTEAYAITEQASIGREMTILDKRLNKKSRKMSETDRELLTKPEKEIFKIKEKYDILFVYNIIFQRVYPLNRSNNKK
ncbi:hypothetical protein [Flavobacterium beibuense]|uniref:hypothetical protein n=1 Tax=Flavobacterium beibuense TaxID=657326 RepID=UPI003A956802